MQMSYRFLINPGTPQAWEFQLQPGINRVGRDEENDFTLNHESVSGAHCEITVNATGVFLKDLGSTNGTFVNSTPVIKVQLKPGQEVQIGQVAMILEAMTKPQG